MVPWWLLYPAHASVTSCVTWCLIGCFLPWPPIPLPLCWLLCPQQQPYYPTHDRKHFRDGIAWLHHCWRAPASCLGSVLLPLPFFWLSISTCHLSPWGLRIPYEWSTLVSFYTSPLHPLWGKMQRQKSKANGWQLLALSIAIFQDVPQIPPCCRAHTSLWGLSLGGPPHWGMLSAQNQNKCPANIFSGRLCSPYAPSFITQYEKAILWSRLIYSHAWESTIKMDGSAFLILAQLQVWHVFVMGLLLNTPLKNLSLGRHDAISSQGLSTRGRKMALLSLAHFSFMCLFYDVLGDCPTSEGSIILWIFPIFCCIKVWWTLTPGHSDIINDHWVFFQNCKTVQLNGRE